MNTIYCICSKNSFLIIITIYCRIPLYFLWDDDTFTLSLIKIQLHYLFLNLFKITFIKLDTREGKSEIKVGNVPENESGKIHKMNLKKNEYKNGNGREVELEEIIKRILHIWNNVNISTLSTDEFLKKLYNQIKNPIDKFNCP